MKIQILGFISVLAGSTLFIIGCSGQKNPSSPSAPAPTSTFTGTPSNTPCTDGLGHTCTPTFTATPSNTATVTSTSTPTNTQTVTSTATITNTPVSTNTPTNTSTSTSTYTPTSTFTPVPTPTYYYSVSYTNGTPQIANINYLSSGVTITVNNVNLPWTQSFPANSGTSYYLFSQGSYYLSISIIQGNTELCLSSCSTNPPSNAVTCSGTIP